MNARFLPLWLAALVSALSVMACDDGPTGGGKQDTTPPAIASINAIDQYHVTVVFTEPVTKSSAEGSWHYWVQESATPEEPVIIGGAWLADDDRTVTLNMYSPMAEVQYDLIVSGVKDVYGNAAQDTEQSFVGSAAADITPPHVLSRSPATNAVNVPVGVPVVVKFSDNVSIGEKTWTSDGDVVPAESWLRGDQLTINPDHTLAPGSHQTVTLSGIQDVSGNTMPDIQWSFTVTTLVDNIPPRLISSAPANFATHIGARTNISLTFSEPLHPDTRFVTIIPYLDVFTLGHLDETGRTLTVETETLLKDNQQYTVYLEPAYFRDLSDNSLDRVTTITFTTGSTLNSGGITGTVTGDPGTGAADPTGASVVAEGDSNVVAVAVAGNDTYQLKHLPDDTYQVVATRESNGDGVLDFFAGDAIGAYGMNLALHDEDPDNVGISGGSQVNGISFPIYDPSAVWGRLSYSGDYFAYVALYTTDGFDPQNPDDELQAALTGAFHDDPWYLNSLMHDFADDDYYVVAYLDVDDNGFFDASIDLYNWYGEPGAPIAVHLANGSDVGDIVITLPDPVPAATTSIRRGTTPRHLPKPNATFQHLGEVVRKSRQHASTTR